MDFDYIPYLPYLFFVAGFLGRVIIPYLEERVNAPEPLKFDWRYVIGQLIAAAGAIIPLIIGEDMLGTIGTLSWLGALVYGWGATDIGRKVQKVYENRRK